MRPIINFPLDGLQMRADDTTNYDAAVAWLNQPLTEDALKYANELAKKFAIPPLTQGINADFVNLKACVASSLNCAGCRSKAREHCFKYIPYLENGRIKANKKLCNLKEVRAIIELSRVPEIFSRATFKKFVTTNLNQGAVQLAHNAVISNEGCYIYGGVGTGKTMLCSIIAVERARIGKTSLFYTVTDMLEGLNDFQNSLRREEKFNKLFSVPCLIIDDLGVENVNDWVATTLFSILDTRYKRGLCTVINSNYAIGAITSRYGDVVGARITRRITELCKIYFMPSPR